VAVVVAAAAAAAVVVVVVVMIIIIELIFYLQDRYEEHCTAPSTCICRTSKQLCECA